MTYLIIGSSGKTGRRVTQRLQQSREPCRAVSRQTAPRFDWQDAGTWGGALEGVTAAYVTYYPDLALPQAADDLERLSNAARDAQVDRLVLLSGRGEKGAEEAERRVLKVMPRSTILRASWFSQNFSEGFFLESLLAGELALPAGQVPVPFVDADDIAKAAVTVLTRPGHAGRTYELTGPTAMTFAAAIEKIAAAAGRRINFVPVNMQQFLSGLELAAVPREMRELLQLLFDEVLVESNASVGDGLTRLLGTPATSFDEFVAREAATGVWDAR